MRRFLDLMDIRKFRWWVQLFGFVLFVYGANFGLVLDQDLPTFACPYVDGRSGNCILFVLQHRLTIPLDQVVTMRGLGLLMALVGFFIWFVALSKSWCGFMCPMGTLQDAIAALREKMGIPYSTYAKPTMAKLGKIKWVLLSLLLLIPLAMANALPGVGKLSHEWATPFCMICPSRTLLPLFSGDFSQLGLDLSSIPKLVLTGLGLLVTGAVLVGAFVKKRFFCLFCPMSALHYVFSKLAFLKLIKEPDKCTRCGNCYRACDVGIHEIAEDLEHRNLTTQNCLLCLDCISACPEEDCLKLTFMGKPLYRSTELGFFKRHSNESK
ncbi:MAG: 4Fe-4S binding protein [bacterium]|nr:4Fe-4S binding protein [bacterium]